MTEKVDSSHDKNKYLLGILTGFLLTLLVLKLVPELLTKSQTSKILIEKALNYLFDIDLGVYQVERNDLIEG